MTSETCQSCGKTKNVNAAGHCQGHDNPTSSKQRLDAIRVAGAGGRSPVVTEAPGLSLKEQLDAIPAPAPSAGPPATAPVATPPVGVAGAKKGPGSILGKKTGAGTEDISAIKKQLDSIPSPGSGGAQPEVAAVPKDLLDSIPTPGSAHPPEASISKNSLDAIAAPGQARSAAAPADPGASLADQLNSIPTPSAAAAGPAPGAQPTGEVPEWMKNFEKHQSSISASIVAQGGQAQAGYGGGHGGGGSGLYSAPDAVAPSYASRGNAEAPPQGSAYNMVIGIVILICIVMFAYLMISKPTPAVMPTDTNTSSPSTPSFNPSKPAPTTTPTMPANNMPVPGAPPGANQPVPGAPASGMPTPDPNAPATQMPTQGNNSVPTQGNNP